MKTIDLHKNYILIHKFRHPDVRMKQWVIDDETQVGHYHDDWNELMEVVEKIELLGAYVEIKDNHCEINMPLEDGTGFNQSFIQDAKIQSVYEAIKAFINWYNDLAN